MHGKCALAVIAACTLTISAAHAAPNQAAQHGKVELQSAGPIAFGPEGILFIGDPKAAAIFAIETNDSVGGPAKAPINIENVSDKIGSLLGIQAENVRIQDVKVNPASGRVYLSVARGRGPAAAAVLLRVDSTGTMSEFPLQDVAFTKAVLPNPPADDANRRQNPRQFAITDMAYIDGQVIIAGLSNEEFASTLRAIPYPFNGVNRGTSVEIYHGSHGQLETRAPIRTFVPISFGGDPQIIAAYTCTPLVRFPLSELRPGVKIRGTTVAELGNRNTPLDIIAYEKGGKNYLLLANAVRGVMKISTDELTTRKGIVQHIRGTAGQPFETIKGWKGVKHLDKLNDTSALVVVEENGGGASLRTLPLP